MARKTAQAKLHQTGDLPKVEPTPRGLMLVAEPLAYDRLVRQIPSGQLMTAPQIRDHLARAADADYTCPLTAGIFLNLVAHAAVETADPDVPWWRVLKKDGELNSKYPGGIEAQAVHLTQEGHTITRRRDRAFVENHTAALADLPAWRRLG